jgi:hypothetical protein
MSKKYLALLPLLVLALAIPAQGQTVVSYFGGQVLLSGCDTDGVGAGSVYGIGIYLAEEDSSSDWEMIAWGQREDEKTIEGNEFDYWLVGTTVLLPVIIDKVRMGPFLTVGLGNGQQNEEADHFTTNAVGGVYFKISKDKKINLYAGCGYSYMAAFKGYAVQFGVSFNSF